MEVKVLTTEPVLEIDGVKLHHHCNGGGLVAENVKVAKTEYVGFYTIIFGKRHPEKATRPEQATRGEELESVFQRVSDKWELIVPVRLNTVEKAIAYIETHWFDPTTVKETPGRLFRRDPELGTSVILLCYVHLWPSGQKKSQTEAMFLKLFSRGKEGSKEPWRNLSKVAKNVVKTIDRSQRITIRALQENVASCFWEWCEYNDIQWPKAIPKKGFQF